MFALEDTGHNGYYRITGYRDGSDWLMTPGRQAPLIRKRGAVGPEHIWFHDDRNATLHIFHAQERRLVAILTVGSDKARAQISASRDGRKLYALVPETKAHRTLKIIDVATGTIASSHGGFRIGSRPAVECADGRLLISFIVRNEDWSARTQGIIRYDAATGQQQISEVAVADLASDFDFQTASPDGRYWIKSDLTALPLRDVGPGVAGMLLASKRERYYGLTVQLWEAFPLRFLRRIVVAWLTADELPRPLHISRPNPGIWAAIAETTARLDAGPLDAPPRSAFPCLSEDTNEWYAIKDMWASVTRANALLYRWQTDSEAFWINTNCFLSCIGVDGTLSPRLFLARKGLRKDTRLPVAEYWRDFVPQDRRTARVVYADGAAIFDGAASGSPHRCAEIPRERDHWIARDATSVIKRVSALKEEHKKLVIPLSSWTDAGSIEAIEALTAEIDEGFEDRAVDGEIRAIFARDGEELDENQFFTIVRRYPRAASAIRRLLERLADVVPHQAELFWAGEKGIGIFAYAAHALAVLDHSALPTLRRYGKLVDHEHESFFARQTVPAIIRAHGWTDNVLDFIVWVLLEDFYNALPDHNEVWSGWGLRDAAIRRYPRNPAAFARRVAREIDAGQFWHLSTKYCARYGSAGLDRLAIQIRQPREPWVNAFFVELERIAEQRKKVSIRA